MYQDAGWSLYIREPEVLWAALQQSHMITAWQQERLVGLVRGITDQQNDFVYPRFTRIERIPAAGNRANVTKKK